MAGPDKQQPHILVINDAVAGLELIQERLTDEGYRVSTDGLARDMPALLQRVERDPPGVIVLDFVILDELRGWQFLQMLRMTRATAHVPVVVCTAAARLVEDLHVHLATMQVQVVVKPFDLDALTAAIARALRG